MAFPLKLRLMHLLPYHKFISPPSLIKTFTGTIFLSVTSPPRKIDNFLLLQNIFVHASFDPSAQFLIAASTAKNI